MNVHAEARSLPHVFETEALWIDAAPDETPPLCDPLEDDRPDDALMVTSDRRLQRLAIIAAETGARFSRDGVAHDAAAWLLAPRRLFGGRPAITACMERPHFERALLLHGLSLGLDAEPADIDDLLADDVIVDDAETDAIDHEASFVHSADGRIDLETDATGSGRRLFTATIVDEEAPAHLQAFHAILGSSMDEVSIRLAARMGARVAALARIRPGFDAGDPLVSAMVSDAIADMLHLIAEDPDSPLADGLDLRIEQRFAA